MIVFLCIFGLFLCIGFFLFMFFYDMYNTYIKDLIYDK